MSCVCCGREAELNEDEECASCEADLAYSCEDSVKEKEKSLK